MFPRKLNSVSVMPAIPVMAVAAAIALVFSIGALSVSAHGVPKGWTENVSGAKTSASDGKKDMLLEFTGSDWCPPCKMLKAKVFDSAHFMAEAPKGFVLVKLDFPRDKSHQTAAVIAQNTEMAEQYRVAAFPTVILADAKGRPYAQWSGYGGESPEQYTKMLDDKRKVRVARDAELEKAAAAKGIDKAKALDAALDSVPISATLMLATYDAEIKQIMTLDADKSAGLYSKYESLKIAPQIEEQVQEILNSSDDPAKAYTKIDAIVKEKKLSGLALQEALFGMALAKYTAEDVPATIELLKQAQKAAPKSEKAERIPGIIEGISK